jgi:hypothetical protein
MKWFYSKNVGKEDAVAYIKGMVASGAFKGHIPLVLLFPDYIVSAEEEINKRYFEAFEKFVQEQTDTSIKEADSSLLAEFCTESMDNIRSCIATAESIIQGRSADAESFRREIETYKNRIVDAENNIFAAVATKEKLEVRLNQPPTVDATLLEQLQKASTNTGWVPVDVVANELYFVSKTPIVCGIYTNNTRQEYNFGKCLAIFVQKDSVIYPKEILFPYCDGNSRHPHVNSGGHLCSGDANYIMSSPDYGVEKKLNVLTAVLTTYNPAAPYRSLTEFIKQKIKTPRFINRKDIAKYLYTPDEIFEYEIRSIPECLRNANYTRASELGFDVGAIHKKISDIVGFDVKGEHFTDVTNALPFNDLTDSVVEAFIDYVFTINNGNNGTHLYNSEIIASMLRMFENLGINSWCYNSGNSGTYKTVPLKRESGNYVFYICPLLTEKGEVRERIIAESMVILAAYGEKLRANEAESNDEIQF